MASLLLIGLPLCPSPTLQVALGIRALVSHRYNLTLKTINLNSLWIRCKQARHSDASTFMCKWIFVNTSVKHYGVSCKHSVVFFQVGLDSWWLTIFRTHSDKFMCTWWQVCMTICDQQMLKNRNIAFINRINFKMRQKIKQTNWKKIPGKICSLDRYQCLNMWSVNVYDSVRKQEENK